MEGQAIAKTDVSNIPNKMTIYILVIAGIEIALLVSSGIQLSKIAVNKDNPTETILSVTGIMGAIVFVHAILWWIWFQYHPAHSHIYLIIMVSVCLILSLTAMAISLVKVS